MVAYLATSAKLPVALRKESVDRNSIAPGTSVFRGVALRKESVDRNLHPLVLILQKIGSLSARRAWIEITCTVWKKYLVIRRSPQGERG